MNLQPARIISIQERIIEVRKCIREGDAGGALNELMFLESRLAEGGWMELWMVGQSYEARPWEFQGIFSTKGAALHACRGPNYFLAPIRINSERPARGVPMPGCYYPAVETPEEAESRRARLKFRCKTCGEIFDEDPGEVHQVQDALEHSDPFRIGVNVDCGPVVLTEVAS